MLQLELVLCPKELFTCACAVQPYKGALKPPFKAGFLLVLRLEQYLEGCLNDLFKFCLSFEKEFNYFEAYMEDVAN